MKKPHTPRRQVSPKRGIQSLAVQGFKSIGTEQRIDIKPLTLMAGANSAGKSSILQPLLLLKQTLEAAYDPGPLLLNGPCAHFTSASQFLSCNANKTRQDFTVELESFQGLSVRMQYRQTKEQGLQIESMAFRDNEDSACVTIRDSMKETDILKLLPHNLKQLPKTVDSEIKGEFHWKVVRDRCFLGFELTDPDNNHRFSFAGNPVVSPANVLIPDILNIIHLPGLRGNPARSYQTTAIEGVFPGTFEPYIASILHHWKRTKDARLSALGKDLQTLGLTWKVSAEPIDDTQVEIHVGRLPKAARGGARDLVNIADVGFGLSQTLPVVVALQAAERGRLVYIEQPEIHLHPRAQVAMGSLLVDAANRGVRVVVETHSSVLLRAIQTAVAQSKIDPDDVSLNWFTRDTKTGQTMVQQADLQTNGAVGDWPEDFDEVTLDVETAYLDAVEMRLAG